MSGREVREYTNLSDPKGACLLPLIRRFTRPCFFFLVPEWGVWLRACADRKFGKGKDKIDDEDITFQRMVAKVRPNRLATSAPAYCCVLHTCMFVLGFFFLG